MSDGYWKRPAHDRDGRRIPGVEQRCKVDGCEPLTVTARNGRTRPGRCEHHRWVGRVEVQVDGRRKVVSTDPQPTAAKATAARATLVAQHQAGTLRAQQEKSPTLAAWLETWLARKIQAGRIKEGTTRRLYADQIRRYLAPPPLGAHRLDALTPGKIVDGLFTARDRLGGPDRIGATTLGLAAATLRTALEAAVEEGLLARNPARKLRDLPEPTPAPRWPWDPPDWLRFVTWLAAAEPRWLPMVLLAGYGGLRRGEICALRVADIDLDTGVICVARQAVTAARPVPLALSVDRKLRRGVAQRTIVRGLKSKKPGATRLAFLPPSACETIAAQLEIDRLNAAMIPEYDNPDGLILSDELGAMLLPELLSRTFRRLVLAYNRAHPGRPVREIDLHTLRHSAASLLVAAGNPTDQVRLNHGHASAAQTDAYTHLPPELGRAMAGRLEQYLAGVDVESDPAGEPAMGPPGG